MAARALNALSMHLATPLSAIYNCFARGTIPDQKSLQITPHNSLSDKTCSPGGAPCVLKHGEAGLAVLTASSQAEGWNEAIGWQAGLPCSMHSVALQRFCSGFVTLPSHDCGCDPDGEGPWSQYSAR